MHDIKEADSVTLQTTKARQLDIVVNKFRMGKQIKQMSCHVKTVLETMTYGRVSQLSEEKSLQENVSNTKQRS